MRRKGVFVWTACGVLASCGLAHAQDAGGSGSPNGQPAAANLPGAEALFERHVEMVGGREAAMQHESRLMKGVSRGSLGASFMTLYYEKSNRFAMIIEQPGAPKIISVFDGEYGWRQVGENPVEILRGVELVEFAESSDFLGEVNYRNRYRKAQTLGVEQDEEGRTLFRVAVESVNGRRSLLFFDQASGFIVRAIVPQVIDGRVFQMQTDLSDYEALDGFKLPRSLRQTVIGTELESNITLRSVEGDVDRSELFERSDEVQSAIDAALAEYEANQARQREAQPGARERDGGGPESGPGGGAGGGG